MYYDSFPPLDFFLNSFCFFCSLFLAVIYKGLYQTGKQNKIVSLFFTLISLFPIFLPFFLFPLYSNEILPCFWIVPPRIFIPDREGTFYIWVVPIIAKTSIQLKNHQPFYFHWANLVIFCITWEWGNLFKYLNNLHQICVS